jgi:D-3-phosphoglycerate dehydrogenase
MKYKIYITDYDYNEISEVYDEFSAIDCEIIELKTKNEDKLIKFVLDADAILVQYAPITSRVIDILYKCKVISRFGIGIDMIDISAATLKKIPVCNVPDYCIDEVADHTLALILTLARKIIPLDFSVRNGEWNTIDVAKPIFNLKEQTLGFVGFGKIPQNLYPKIKLIFGNIIVFDPYLKDETIKKYNLKSVTFYNLITNSDFISIHCPLNEDTRHLFDIKEFYLMKKTVYIINTSRGPIINTVALYRAVKDKIIAGAALDVLEQEPPEKDLELLELNNIIITPHSSYYSESSIKLLKRITARNVVKILSNEEPINMLNKVF